MAKEEDTKNISLKADNEAQAAKVASVAQPVSNSPRVTLGIGAGLLILGSLLSWVNLRSVSFFNLTRSVSGIDRGSGILSLLLGIIFLITALARKGQPGKFFSVWIGIFTILLNVFLIYEWITIAGIIQAGTPDVQMTFGIGFYLTLIGSILSLIGGFLKS
jgi:hypothetical protein